jgi:glycosyltransferase involved in cell wall biosynthesis
MKLLFASEALVPPIGGAERTLLEWTTGLEAGGHATRAVYLGDLQRPEDARYWRGRAAQRAEVGRLVSQAIEADRPDVVIAQLHGAPTALAAAGRAGVPGVLAVPSYEALCKLAFLPGSSCPPDGDCVTCPSATGLAAPERTALRQARAQNDRVLRHAAGVVVPSQAVARAVRRWSGRDSQIVYPVGAALPAPVGADPAGPVVCVAARWSEHKGAGLLAKLVVAARPRDVVVTAPGLSPAQRSAIEASGGRIRDAGPIDELLAGASLLLMPSQWEEPFGRVAWEALARGVPVVVSDVGGLREFVPDALRVGPHDDPQAWSSAIDRLLRDEQAWTQAAREAREAASRLLEPAPLDRLEGVLVAVSRPRVRIG